ncbi:hypothetical protein LI170_16855, partial [Desulfovibrio desulfuricans]|uniref:hypothetical protein n=1 Tax=Desulfovibrio desulfuricans TaxID=876 RepID=UPI001D0879EB
MITVICFLKESADGNQRLCSTGEISVQLKLLFKYTGSRALLLSYRNRQYRIFFAIAQHPL